MIQINKITAREISLSYSSEKDVLEIVALMRKDFTDGRVKEYRTKRERNKYMFRCKVDGCDKRFATKLTLQLHRDEGHGVPRPDSLREYVIGNA